jgi:hypothetical protein
MTGGVVDLDLLFQIPQNYTRIMGGRDRKQTFEVQQWSMRERANRMVDLASSRRKKGYSSSKGEIAVWEILSPEWISAQTVQPETKPFSRRVLSQAPDSAIS